MKHWISIFLVVQFFSCSSPDHVFIREDKLPLNEKMFYQENTVERSVARLLDGNLLVNFNPGSRLLNTGPHTIVCNFPEEWHTVPKRIRIFDGGSDDPFTAPTKFFLVRKSDGEEIEAGRFEGTLYKQWKEIIIPKPFASDRLIIRGYSNNGAGAFYGTELEIYGDYNKRAVKKYVYRKAQPLKYILGTNGFVWDFMQDPKDPSHVQHAYAPKLDRHLEMGISTERFYMTLADLEPKENEFAFNPSKGGWYYDSLFALCKRAGIEPLPDIMGLAPHVFNTWPDNDNDPNNQHPHTYSSPVRYEDRDRREEPRSYRDIAHAAFVVASRWGNNAGVDEKLLGTPFNGGVREIPPNIKKKGLGLVRYIEFLNEPDSYWAGAYEYMSGYKLAAFLSAIYDGHKGTIDAGYGPGVAVGIKHADPSMRLVISGFSRANTDALKAITDWSRAHRGLKSDGSVDLPYDVINYHKYSTDAGMLGENSPNTTAMAPELSGVLDIASDFVDYSNAFTGGKEVWLTEWGIDYHAQSLYAAPQIGDHSRFEVIGAWAIRSMLLHSIKGVDRLMWFKTFDDDSLNSQFFSTMSLLSAKDPYYPRRVVGDYFAQMKQFGDYVPDSLLSTSPFVARFKRDDGSLLYAVWGVENLSPAVITKGGRQLNSFHFAEGTGRYVLTTAAGTVIIKHFVPGGDTMKEEAVRVKDGKYAIDYGMTPVMIEVHPQARK